MAAPEVQMAAFGAGEGQPLAPGGPLNNIDLKDPGLQALLAVMVQKEIDRRAANVVEQLELGKDEHQEVQRRWCVLLTKSLVQKRVIGLDPGNVCSGNSKFTLLAHLHFPCFSRLKAIRRGEPHCFRRATGHGRGAPGQRREVPAGTE